MKSIYRYSTYGFLDVEDTCLADKADIELAALCISGVYGAAFIASQGRLHIIYNPEKTNLYEINCAIIMAGYYSHLHEAARKIFRINEQEFEPESRKEKY